MDSCIRSVWMTPFPAFRDANTRLRPRLFAGLLAHRDDGRRRISRYQMLCRQGCEQERAFVVTICWPSAFTIVFLALLPAVGFGLAALFAPALVHTRRHWSTYFAYGALIGSLCGLGYGVWLESSVSSDRVTIHDDMGDELE